MGWEASKLNKQRYLKELAEKSPGHIFLKKSQLP